VTRNGDRCPDNLLARSRQGPLSAVERRALDAHLAGCDLCRSAVALGELYDEAPDGPQPGDHAVIARLASRVAGRSSGGRRRSLLAAFAAALALLVIAGGAAAWVASRRRASTPPAAAIVAGPAVARRDVSTPAALPDSAPERGDRRAEGSRAVAVRPRGRASQRPAPAPLAGPAELSAGVAELFADANAARRTGDLRGAIARYLALEARYPASSEAGVSRVSAGDLLLRLGNPAAALEQLDGYLGARGSEPLAPEALFGRARCLRALGRDDEERAAWEELGRRFPGSIYEPFGRRRIDELDR